MSELKKASEIAINVCMGAQKGESILVLTDENKREIALSLYETALENGYESLLVEMKSREINGEEPPEYVADLMKKFDIVLAPTTKSLTHTDARRNASKLGARIATFPGITVDSMVRGLSADYNKIAELTIKLSEIMDKTDEVRVTAPNGTDITMNISGRKTIPSKGLFHKKGESGNLPTGEAFAAPVEGKSDGVFVVDGSMAGIGMMEAGETITIKVEDGYATDITGSMKAEKLVAMLNKVGRDARNIAEIGIGTNDKAKLSGLLLEDEKVMGTVHIALGNNLSMGGSINVPIHLDGVIKEPSVWFDGNMIMEKGKLLVTI